MNLKLAKGTEERIAIIKEARRARFDSFNSIDSYDIVRELFFILWIMLNDFVVVDYLDCSRNNWRSIEWKTSFLIKDRERERNIHTTIITPISIRFRLNIHLN